MLSNSYNKTKNSTSKNYRPNHKEKKNLLILLNSEDIH